MVDYKVALEITAAGNVEQFLNTIASKLFGIHGKTKEISKELGNWGKLVGGLALVTAGVETLKFVDHIAKAGGELQRQENIFRSAGNSMVDTAKAIQGAFAAIQQVPGVDAVDAMKRYRELAGATQDNAGSIGVLPDFLKAQVVYGATTGADPEEGMQRIAKMIELRQGGINRETHKIEPGLFAKELDVAVKALQVGQGLITANDLQMLVKQAGPMAKGMDPMKFWSIYLASLEDMGGARTGTAMTAVARQVLGGIMTPKVADEWERVGMLNAPGEGWRMTKKGHVDIYDPQKAIRGYDTFRDDGFQKFIDDFVRPALQSHGFKSDKELNAELYSFGSTETARRLYSMYLTGNEQVEAEQKKLQLAQGTSSYDSIFKGGDYQQGIDSLTSSIKSLEEALGGPAGQAIGKMATELAEQINKLAQVAEAHPHLVEIGTYAVTAAAGLAILAGSIIAVTAALRIGGWIMNPTTTPKAPEAPKVPNSPEPPKPSEPPKAPKSSAETLLEDAAKEAAPAVESGLRNAIKSGVKGGIVGGLIEWAGEWAINKALPLTPEQKQFRDMSILDRIGEIWKSIGGNVPGEGPPKNEPVYGTWDRARNTLTDAYGSRPGVDAEAAREASRAAALSSLGSTTLRDGTQSGVIAGLSAASGEARSIVSSWFQGATPKPPGLDPETIVNKNYGDRKTLYHDDPERQREASRAKALSNMPTLPLADVQAKVSDAAKQGMQLGLTAGASAAVSAVQTSLQAGATAGITTGATGARPAVQSAMQSGTQAGVVSGLQAASGAARGIVASWFAGIGPGIAGAAKAAAGGVGSHTKTASAGSSYVKTASAPLQLAGLGSSQDIARLKGFTALDTHNDRSSPSARANILA